MRSPQARNPTSENRDLRSEVGVQEYETLIQEAFSRLIATHGDLGIALEDFTEHLSLVAARGGGRKSGQPKRRNAIGSLINGDYLGDIYLTAACALKTNAAWERFFTLYSAHIEKVAHNASRTHQQARDVFSDVIVHLFSPDSSGRSRIASYNGEAALSTWLACIVRRLAINRSQLRSEIEFNKSAPLDSLNRTPSKDVDAAFDAVLFRSKYSKAIEGAFRTAADTLTERERLVLAMRCDEDLRGEDIAATLGVHPAQISRSFRKAQLKFQTTAVECLSVHYKLSAEAIEECLAEMPHLSQLSISAFLLSSGFISPNVYLDRTVA